MKIFAAGCALIFGIAIGYICLSLVVIQRNQEDHRKRMASIEVALAKAWLESSKKTAEELQEKIHRDTLTSDISALSLKISLLQKTVQELVTQARQPDVGTAQFTREINALAADLQQIAQDQRRIRYDVQDVKTRLSSP